MDFSPTLILKLRSARRVTVLTGAGISAESGVPTFRDAQSGLWASFKPEELATPRAFRANPKLVWEWYAWRRQLVAKAEPNAGHIALVELEKLFPHFTLVTQNVDGLHTRAGSRDVIEIHGNIARTKCSEENSVVTEWREAGEIPPRCPLCGGLLRPDVVWFEEMLPEKEIELAFEASRNCEVFFSIGTSAIVYPAAALPEEALASGAALVEVNPDRTPLTARASHFLRGRAGEVLPELLQALR